VLSITGPLHVEDLSFIHQSVDNGVRDGVIGKNLIELSKRDVRRGYRAQSGIVPSGDHLKEQIACLGVQLHVTELVNDQDLRSSVLIEFGFDTE